MLFYVIWYVLLIMCFWYVHFLCAFYVPPQSHRERSQDEPKMTTISEIWTKSEQKSEQNLNTIWTKSEQKTARKSQQHKQIRADCCSDVVQIVVQIVVKIVVQIVVQIVFQIVVCSELPCGSRATCPHTISRDGSVYIMKIYTNDFKCEKYDNLYFEYGWVYF